MIKMLVMNFGGTSSKLAIYDNDKQVVCETIYHSSSDLAKCPTILDQAPLREKCCIEFLKKNNLTLKNINVVAIRGPLLKPVSGGTFEINDAMVKDVLSKKYGFHPINIGAIIVNKWKKKYGIKAYTTDMGTTDEMTDLAHVSGLKEFPRVSIFHTLNSKCMARRYAKETNRQYKDVNVLVCHIGGGLTVSWHKDGKTVDTTNGVEGLGPWTPNRVGSLSPKDIVSMCFSKKYTESEIHKLFLTSGGFVSHLGTHDLFEIEKKALAGNKKYNFYLEAMAYQVTKEIGALYFVGHGKQEKIIFTGGAVRCKPLMDYFHKYLDGLIDIIVYPGENEMDALNAGALRVINKEEKIQVYKS